MSARGAWMSQPERDFYGRVVARGWKCPRQACHAWNNAGCPQCSRCSACHPDVSKAKLHRPYTPPGQRGGGGDKAPAGQVSDDAIVASPPRPWPRDTRRRRTSPQQIAHEAQLERQREAERLAQAQPQPTDLQAPPAPMAAPRAASRPPLQAQPALQPAPPPAQGAQPFVEAPLSEQEKAAVTTELGRLLSALAPMRQAEAAQQTGARIAAL